MGGGRGTIAGGGRVSVTIEVPLGPAEAFAAALDELGGALERMGGALEPRTGGRIAVDGADVGRIEDWRPGEAVLLRWQPASWQPDAAGELRIRVEPIAGGTRIVLEQHGWLALLGSAGERAGWFASQVAAPFLHVTTSGPLGAWITDRRARRPSGPESSGFYADPLYHRPMFVAMLAELSLERSDYLLDVGCGGGAFLEDALRSGCRAAGIDHSPEMVRLTRDANSQAVVAGRLDVREAPADRIPFPADTFTCATMHAVLGFLSDPVAVLAEMRRVLAPGGRLMVLGSDPALRGTPAAPEPIGSHLSFYERDALLDLARRAGFGDARVERRSVEEAARAVGVPDEHLSLFTGPGPEFLLARKS